MSQHGERVRQWVRRGELAAIEKNAKEYARLFLQACYDQDERKCTALHYCARKNSDKIAAFILQHEKEYHGKHKRKKNLSKQASRVQEWSPPTKGGKPIRLLRIVGEEGALPVHYAAAYFPKRQGDEELDVSNTVLELFIREDASTLNEVDDFGMTPLHHATIRKNDVSGLKLLEWASKSTIEVEDMILIKDQQNQNSIHYSAYYGCPMSLEKMLDITRGTEGILDIRDQEGDNALHMAAEEGSLQCCKVLIKYGGKALMGSCDKDGNTAIHLSVNGGETAATRLLLKHTEKTERGQIFKKPNHEGEVPITLAAQTDVDMFKVLADEFHAKVTEKNSFGNTPLAVACIWDKPEIVEYLLENYAKQIRVNYQNEKGRTPLLLACRNANPNCLRLLLDHNKADPDSNSGFLGAVKTLFSDEDEGPQYTVAGILKMSNKRADPYAEDINERTALHLIANQLFSDDSAEDTEEYLDCVRLLLDESVIPDKYEATFLAQKDSLGSNSALHIAAEHGVIPLVAILLEHHADANEQNDSDETPMHLAAKHNHAEIIGKLAEADDDVVKDDDEDANTALHIAATHGHLEACEWLIYYNAKVGVKNYLGETPLDLAAKHGHVHICKYLLENEAILDPKSKDQKTPLMLAAENGHTRVVDFLLEKGAQPYVVTATVYDERKQFDGTILRYEKGGRNALELAIDSGSQDAIKAILLSDHWEESLRNSHISPRGNVTTPLRQLISKYPELAIIVLNRCVTWEGNSKEIINFNFEFLEDLYSVKGWYDCRGEEVTEQALALHEDYEIMSDTSAKKVNQVQFEQPETAISVDGDDARDGGFTRDYDARLSQRQAESSVGSDTTSMTAATTAGIYHENGKLKTASNMYQYVTTSKYSNEEDFVTSELIKPGRKQYRTNHVLDIIMKSGDNRLLKHPLVNELLNLKWESYGYVLYLADFLIYVAFVILLNCYAMLLPRPNMFVTTMVTLPDDTTLACSVLRPDVPFNKFAQYSFYQAYVAKATPLTLKDGSVANCSIACAATWTSFVALQITLCVFLALRLLYEIKALVYSKLEYFSDFMNFVELTLYGLTFYYVWGDFANVFGDRRLPCSKGASWGSLFPINLVKSEAQQICGSYAVMLSWLNLLLFMRRFPRLGIYMMMFQQVLLTFVEVFCVFILFVVAFTMSFSMLLSNKVPFLTVRNAFFSTLVMMIGELEYQDVMLDHMSHRTCETAGPNGTCAKYAGIEIGSEMWLDTATFAMYGIFLFLVSIIVTNLLTGLAVDDIDKIRRNADAKRIGMLIEDTLMQEFEIPSYFARIRRRGAAKFVTFNMKEEEDKLNNMWAISRFFQRDRLIDPEDLKSAVVNPLWIPEQDDDQTDPYEEERGRDQDKMQKQIEELNRDLKAQIAKMDREFKDQEQKNEQIIKMLKKLTK